MSRIVAVGLHLEGRMNGTVGSFPNLRQASRALTRTPLITAAAVATLALGCGAAVAIGTIVDTLLFRPLPAVENRTALLLYPTAAGALDPDDDELALGEIEAIADSGAVAELATFVNRNLTLTGGDPVRVAGSSISPNTFGLLGVRPILGRDFRPDEAAPWGQETVALLAHGLWQRRFGSDPAIVGRTIQINQRAITVVGVLPPGFGLPNVQQIYLPWRSDPDWERDSRDFWVVARLAEGAERVPAQAALDLVTERLVASGTIADRECGFRLVPLRDALYDPHARKMMGVLSLLAAGVLGVACFNVANLILARNASREGELAVRLALGASRRRILAESLTESLLLGTAGAAGGLLTGAWAFRWILSQIHDDMPAWLAATMRIEGRTALGTALLALLVTVVAGLLPALRAGRTDVQGGLAATGRARTAPTRRPLERVLVALQFAGALVVLSVASWLLASDRAIANANPGFDPTHLLSFRLYLPGDAYDPQSAKIGFRTALLDRLAALPGATAAAITGHLPADDGGDEQRVTPEGIAPSPETSTPILVLPTTRTLFDALGVSLQRGELWSRAEDDGAPGGSAVIGRALAEKLWPGADPIGRRLRIGLDPAAEPVTVVGVAPDLTYEEIQEQTSRSRYQLFVPLARYSWRSLAAIVRAEGDPAALAAPARRALAELEPDAPMFDVATYPARLRGTYEERTMVGRISASFGGAGLLLAAVGAFGLLSHSIAVRRRELGVRMALGAAPSRLVRSVVRDGLTLSLPGLVLGFAAAWALAHALSGFLFGIEPTEPMRFLLVLSIVVAAVAFASSLAARRAVDVDPLEALRAE